MEDWSFHDDDPQKSDNRRSNAPEGTGQTLRIEVKRGKLGQTT
jgi:hypothetical protein